MKLEIRTKKTRNPLCLISGLLIGVICGPIRADFSVLPIATNEPKEAASILTRKMAKPPKSVAKVTESSAKLPLVAKVTASNQTEEDPAVEKYLLLLN